MQAIPAKPKTAQPNSRSVGRVGAMVTTKDNSS